DLAHLRLLSTDAPAGLDAFAYNILAREEFLREALIHYDDRKRIKLIRFFENSALQERDAHCLEIIQPGDAHGSIVPLSFGQRMLFDIEISRYVTSCQRQRHDDAGGIDSWNRSELRK